MVSDDDEDQESYMFYMDQDPVMQSEMMLCGWGDRPAALKAARCRR